MRLSQNLRWPLALVLLACLSNGIVHAATTAAPERANAAASDIEPPATPSPIDLSSAIDLQASVAAEAAQFTQQPAVPIPKNLSKVPAYQYIARLAPALPIVQAGIAAPETEDLLANLALHSTSQKTSPISSRASTLRVMIVGDSITQGQNGDHTWRYRIWQWFQSQGISVQFVGPYNGTYLNTAQSAPAQAPQPPPLYGTTTSNPEAVSANGKYAADVDAAFLSNSNHFANWGRAMVVDQGLIQNMLSQYPADMILVALGFNDLGFYYSDCYGLLNTVQNFINNARKANPNVKFAFANVVQRTFVRQDLVTNITTYNSILPKYLAEFSSPQSEVHLVEFEQNYACGTTSCGAGYDGLHPNAWGEYQIANAFSKSLIDGFGIGKTPLAIPSQGDSSLVRPLGVPTNFKVFSSAQGVSATWDPVFGAYSYDVQVSINGGGGGFSSGTAATNRWDSTWPVDGWTYAVSVRATAGNQVGSYTSTLSAVAHPQLAAPPTNVVVNTQSDGFTISWSPPTGPYSSNIVEYNVLYWDTTPSDCQYIAGAAFKSSPATITGLEAGKNYLVALVAWNSNGQGLPYDAPYIVPGAALPPPVPSGLSAISLDGTTAHLSWTGSSSSGSYEVYVKNTTGTSSYVSIGNTTQTCSDQYFLYPGSWLHEFAVVAYNGNSRSGKSGGIVPNNPGSSTRSGPTCAPSPSWCPNPPAASGGYVGGCAGCGGGGGVASTTIVGGTTETLKTTETVSGKTVTTVYTTVVGGTTSVVSGVSPTGSFTTVIGGRTTTETSAGKTITTVIGGTTTVESQTSKTSSSTGGVVTSSIPSVDSNGGCTGPGCSGGHCTDLFCVSFGCKGSGCDSGGLCKSGTSCISLGCVGPNCVDGSCKGAGCSTKGCAGSDCNSSNGRCKGPNCISVGCAGSDCGSNGVCTGPNCSEVTCFGLNCAQGSCVGPSCTHFGTNPGGGSNAPQSNPDDECGTNGDGVTSAESCDVTCYTRTSTETCSFPSCTETTGCSVTATTETTTLTGAQFEVPTADLFPAAYSLSDQGVLALITSAMASENSVDAATSPSTTTIPTSTTPTSTCTFSPSSQCTLTPNYEPGDVCNTANQQACNAEKTKAMFCACAASDCQWQVQNNGDCSNASCVQSGGTASCGST